MHDAAAILQDADTSSASLIAYVSPAFVSTKAVVAACTARLPHYMVPSAVVCLEVMPCLNNGKVWHTSAQMQGLRGMKRCDLLQPHLDTLVLTLQCKAFG